MKDLPPCNNTNDIKTPKTLLATFNRTRTLESRLIDELNKKKIDLINIMIIIIIIVIK